MEVDCVWLCVPSALQQLASCGVALSCADSTLGTTACSNRALAFPMHRHVLIHALTSAIALKGMQYIQKDQLFLIHLRNLNSKGISCACCVQPA
jgi:hypothetical protein